MSYYDSLDMKLFIPRENFDAAFKAVCELNDHNELKGGRASPEDPDAPEVGPRRDKWFSWMAWDYSLTCQDLADAMIEARFDVTETEKGLRINWFEGDRMGEEALFLEALAPYYDYTNGVPFSEWEGEDGARWRYEYHQDGTVIKLTGKTVWV